MRPLVALALLATMLLVGGCGPYADKTAIDRVMNQYFAAVRAGDVDEALDLWGEPAFQGLSHQQWRARLWLQVRRLGDLEQYELTPWWAEDGAGGRVLHARYRVNCSRFPADEEFALAGATAGELRIVAYTIASPGLAAG